METEPDEPRYPCSVCGRKFVTASLEKHENACKIQANKKRKVFDSGKQRATGEKTDISIRDVRKAQKEIAQAAGTFEPPKTKWREKHEQFQEGIKSSRNVEFALKTGSPLPPPPTSKVPSDYVECDYCGRNFSQNAADRHIPFCREQSRKKGQGSTSSGGHLKPQNRSAPGGPPRSRSQPPKQGRARNSRDAPPRNAQRNQPKSMVDQRSRRRDDEFLTPSPPDSRSPSPPMPRRRGHSFDRAPPSRHQRGGEPRRLKEPLPVARGTKLPQANHLRRQSPAHKMTRHNRRY